MVDLKKLETLLDEALSNETPETLSNWLMSQRKSNLENFFGVGEFSLLDEIPYTFSDERKNNAIYHCTNATSTTIISEKLSNAA